MGLIHERKRQPVVAAERRLGGHTGTDRLLALRGGLPILIALGSLIALPVHCQRTLGNARSTTPVMRTEYRLGPGDELSLTFPFNAELNHNGPVGPDGRFTVPLVGSVLLEGSTIAQATFEVARALREGGIVADAHPSITILHYNATVFVGGEVNKQGLFPLSIGMDPFQAVIAAGGLLESAKLKRVAVIRRGLNGLASVKWVDLRAYVKGTTGMHLDPLEPRDVVFVPKSSIGEADRWVDLYLNKLLPFGKSFNYNLGNNGTAVIP